MFPYLLGECDRCDIPSITIACRGYGGDANNLHRNGNSHICMLPTSCSAAVATAISALVPVWWWEWSVLCNDNDTASMVHLIYVSDGITWQWWCGTTLYPTLPINLFCYRGLNVDLNGHFAIQNIWSLAVMQEIDAAGVDNALSYAHMWSFLSYGSMQNKVVEWMPLRLE